MDDKDLQKFLETMFPGMGDMVQRQQMETSDAVHSFYRWLRELDEEGLRNIELLLSAIGAIGDDKYRLAAYVGHWRAYVLAKLEEKSGWCVACNKNHMDELIERPADF